MIGERLYSSTELTRAAGCTRKALRVYQARGLIHTVTDRGNYRYDAEAIDRLRLIVAMRELGLSLERIKQLLSVRDTCPEHAGAVAGELAHQIGELVTEVTTRIESLSRLREHLIQARETLFGCRTCEEPVSSCADCATAGKLDQTSRALLVAK